MRPSLIASLVAAVGLQACAPSPAPPAAAAPASIATAPAGEAMVAAANPLAVEAGLQVLRAGGSAVDAAVAVQSVLGLVEPQSSGLGGGAFMLVYDPASRRVTAYDGRETAPAAVTERLFLDEGGRPMPLRAAILSGRSTGVPGVPALLERAHRDHGRRPWASLFTPAIRLADEGFIVSPRLSGFINPEGARTLPPDLLRYFTRADGRRYRTGDRLRNADYAVTLRRLAAEGARDGFYRGPIGAGVVERVRADGGVLSTADLAGYRVNVAEALCRPWRAYVVCTQPPPSSGVALLQLLGMLERTDIAQHPNAARGWYLFAEASRLMYADRDRWVGDPAFVGVPLEGLLEPAYLARRAALIGPRAAARVAAGDPARAPEVAADRTREPAGTSHFTIVDGRGMVVSVTTTVESVFGSGRMSGGMVLNNQLTDFSFSPVVDGRPAANAPGPGRRPRSSMAPVVLLDGQGRFVGALGSPGGNSILAYNAKTLIGWLDWRMPIQAAVDLPNLVARGDRVSAETSLFAPEVVAGLRALGLNLPDNPTGENSGLHAVVVGADGRLEGAADPRREGVARRP